MPSDVIAGQEVDPVVLHFMVDAKKRIGPAEMDILDHNQ